jgi:hypothetical protein
MGGIGTISHGSWPRTHVALPSLRGMVFSHGVPPVTRRVVEGLNKWSIFLGQGMPRCSMYGIFRPYIYLQLGDVGCFWEYFGSKC